MTENKPACNQCFLITSGSQVFSPTQFVRKPFSCFFQYCIYFTDAVCRQSSTTGLEPNALISSCSLCPHRDWNRLCQAVSTFENYWLSFAPDFLYREPNWFESIKPP